MKYTKYGEFMRILRIRSHEVMGDTAKLFNVKIPFVSAVESGKRNVPEEWIPILIEHYNLNNEEQQILKDAIDNSKTQMKINLIGASDEQRSLAFRFQRSFEKLDKETTEAIINLLDKDNS